MMKRQLLATAAVAATIGFSGVALANGGSYNPESASSSQKNAGIYVGAQGGYALSHWDNVDTAVKPSNVDIKTSNSDDFTGRVFAGYAFNQYLALEAGWAYLPSDIHVSYDGTRGKDIKNWAADLSGVMTVPVYDRFGVYGKVGLGYLRSKEVVNLENVTNNVRSKEDSWNVTFGAGAYYDITPQLRATVGWRRYEGHTKLDNEYQPNPDLFLAGLQYRFSTDF